MRFVAATPELRQSATTSPMRVASFDDVEFASVKVESATQGDNLDKRAGELCRSWVKWKARRSSPSPTKGLARLSRFAMNKKQAAEFLGISPRTLERAVSDSRIAARYEKGKTSNVLVFDQDELERYKAEQDSPTYLPTVERAADAVTSGGAPTNRMESPTNFANSDKALATFGEVPDGSVNGMALALLQALSQLQPGGVLGAVAASGESGPPLTPPAQKLLLSLTEAQSYSGLSRANLMDAIHDQSLVAQKIGRGWKIKRRDLESYVEGL